MSPLFGGLGLRRPKSASAMGLPSVSIGINIPVYPELVPVPGYPLYCGPRGEPRNDHRRN